MRMEPKQMPVRDILEQIAKGELSLPHFQRGYDWKPEDQKDLLASFLYDVPIGSILLLENSPLSKNLWVILEDRGGFQGYDTGRFP